MKNFPLTREIKEGGINTRKPKDTYDVSDEELLYLAAIENTQEKVRSGREALNAEHQRFNNSQMLHQQQQAALLAAMMHHHNNP